MATRKIYFDHAASTPVDPAVLEAMKPYFTERFGNPGSVHGFGQEAIAAIDRSRETITKAIGAEFRQVVFAASATEANNLAIHGALLAAYGGHHSHDGSPRKRVRLIVSAIEHESIRESAALASRVGVDVVTLPVDKEGFIDEKILKESLTPETVLVSVQYANNEIGTVQSIAKIAAIIREFRERSGVKKEGVARYPLLHTDAAQALQFLGCDVKTLGVDLMTLSAHKAYGPKGAGALYLKDISLAEPLVQGGGQEYGLRPGTENVPAIVGFAKAVELVMEKRADEAARISSLRDMLLRGIKAIAPDTEMNGPAASTGKLPNILNVHFPGRSAQDLLTRLDLAGLAASSGSACRSRALEASYVIKALGHPEARAKESIRFSLGRSTEPAEIEDALQILKGALKR